MNVRPEDIQVIRDRLEFGVGPEPDDLARCLKAIEERDQHIKSLQACRALDLDEIRRLAAELSEVRTDLMLAKSKDGMAEVYLERNEACAALERLQKLVDEQAEDEALWFHAETAAEAYLQHELRRLHAAIEGEG